LSNSGLMLGPETIAKIKVIAFVIYTIFGCKFLK
jgi:hypothetical protein